MHAGGVVTVAPLSPTPVRRSRSPGLLTILRRHRDTEIMRWLFTPDPSPLTITATAHVSRATATPVPSMHCMPTRLARWCRAQAGGVLTTVAACTPRRSGDRCCDIPRSQRRRWRSRSAVLRIHPVRSVGFKIIITWVESPAMVSDRPSCLGHRGATSGRVVPTAGAAWVRTAPRSARPCDFGQRVRSSRRNRHHNKRQRQRVMITT